MLSISSLLGTDAADKDVSGPDGLGKTVIPMPANDATIAIVAMPSFEPAVASAAVVRPTLVEAEVTVIEVDAASTGAVSLPNRPRHINSKLLLIPW